MTGWSPEIVELEPQEAIAVRGDVVIADLPAFFERAFGEVEQAVAAAGVEIVGPPFGYYPAMPTATVVVEAGFPVSARTELRGDVHRLVLPGGRAVQAVHVGPFETMVQTYAELQAWMADHGLEASPPMWECYLSDPAVDPDPATWRTGIVWPIS